jgi:hypothetical protein
MYTAEYAKQVAEKVIKDNNDNFRSTVEELIQVNSALGKFWCTVSVYEVSKEVLDSTFKELEELGYFIAQDDPYSIVIHWRYPK